MAKHYTSTFRIKAGKYKVKRDDGREFNIVKMWVALPKPAIRWVIEDAASFKTDSNKTLSGCLSDIKHAWTPLTK